MCALRPAPRGSRGTRRGRRPARIPGSLLALLGCLPGFAAVTALVLCTGGADHLVTARPAARAGLPTPARSPAAPPHTAVRPPIVPRTVWLDARTRRRQPPPRYDDKVVAVFVHHTDSPNGYDCADAPRIIRYLYTGQTGARDWDDIGYNFLVDRCGTIYEGRAGGVDRPVTGAHTQGFNHRTAGIAALGTFTAGVPVPQPMVDAIAALTAWKLGLADVDPRTMARLTSSNNLSRYAAGTTATLPALAGHNDGYMTSCPGAALTARLPEIRATAARLQGREPVAAPSGTLTGTPQAAFRVLPFPPPNVRVDTTGNDRRRGR
ncbi:peptidoglycan recognition protein [Streptomyces sp. DSM 15324]|uniref:peptidoglycan recognition protein family protein n=1 Tax=Streptomyces sp. DSM 15324 TaxID=1739111 RepID=UPI00268CC479